MSTSWRRLTFSRSSRIRMWFVITVREWECESEWAMSLEPTDETARKKRGRGKHILSRVPKMLKVKKFYSTNDIFFDSSRDILFLICLSVFQSMHWLPFCSDSLSLLTVSLFLSLSSVFLHFQAAVWKKTRCGFWWSSAATDRSKTWWNGWKFNWRKPKSPRHFIILYEAWFICIPK